MGKSGRHKRGKPGHQGGGKRRQGGGGRRNGRPAAQQQAAPTAIPDWSGSDDDGVLRIGGVVVRVDSSGYGRVQVASGGGSRGGDPQHQQQRRRGSAGGASPASWHDRQGVAGGFASGSDESDSSGASESKEESGSESDDVDDAELAMQDYLANLAAADEENEEDESEGAGQGRQARNRQLRGGSGSGSSSSGSELVDDGEGGSAAKRRRMVRAQYEVLRRFSGFDMQDEGKVEELGWPGLSSGDDADDSSSSDSSSSGSDGETDSDDVDGSSSEENEEYSGSGGEGQELMEADLEQLSLAQRYPVQVRPRPPPLPGQQQEGKQRGKKKGKGAKGGKLAPGEKKRLKHERRQAKRAARAAARGFDLPWVNRQLEEFVARQGDVQVFGPFGKHECGAVQRLAALYGCKASLQGSKANRKLVLVAATPRTSLPQGERLLQIGQILAAQTAAERVGAAYDGRLAAAVAGADLSSILPASLTTPQGGRWAAARRASGSGKKAAAAGDGGSAGRKQRSRLKPVAFVSVGAINPDEAVEVALPAGAANSAAAAAAAAGLEALVAEGSDGGLAATGLRASALLPHSASEAGASDVGGGSDGGCSDTDAAADGSGALAAAGIQLLEVVEDFGGSSDGGRAAAAGGSDGEDEEARARLDSGGALYMRMTALALAPAAAAPPGGSSPRSARGSAAAEGITNPGRLLGLGLALGIGPEVFGAPGPAEVVAGAGAPAAAHAVAADLSPLSPLLSKSEMRRLQRRASGGRPSPGQEPASAAAASGGSAPLSGGHQRHQQLGRKGKPGRSKQERRSRGGSAAAAAGSDGEQQVGGLGLGASPGLGGGEEGGEAGGRGGLVAGDYGYFERHTTGIGSRLLSKWGFAGEGAGLGRHQQGRSEPVQVTRRAKGLGLGAER